MVVGRFFGPVRSVNHKHKGRVHIVVVKYLNGLFVQVGTRGVCLPVTAASAVILA